MLTPKALKASETQGAFSREPQSTYSSVQRWQLERAVEEAGTDTVTVLQGAFIEFGVERLATPQETLLLHTIYKAMVSLIENQPTGDERQKSFEDVLDIPDEQLIGF